MSRLRVVICRIEDETDGGPDTPMEVARFEWPETDLAAVAPAAVLDALEETTHQRGQAILRRLLQAQWETVDAAAVAEHRRSFPPCDVAG